MISDIWYIFIKPYLPLVLMLSLIFIGTGVTIKKGVANHKARKYACITECKYNRNLKYIDYFENSTPYLICICSAKNSTSLALHAIIIDNRDE